MPTLQGRELEEGEPGMEQLLAERGKRGTSGLLRPSTGTQSCPCTWNPHPSFPALGWSRAGGKLGHCQAAVPVPVPAQPGPGHSSSQAHPALLLSWDMGKGRDEVPQELLGWGTRCHHSQISGFTKFYLSKDLKFLSSSDEPREAARQEQLPFTPNSKARSWEWLWLCCREP